MRNNPSAIRALSKEQLLALRLRLYKALSDIRSARALTAGGYDDAKKYSLLASLCGFASSVKGAADIFMSAAKIAPGGSKVVAGVYEAATASVAAVSEHGLNRASAVGKMVDAAAGFGPPGAQVTSAILSGSLESASDVAEGRFLAATGAHISQYEVALDMAEVKAAGKVGVFGDVVSGSQDIAEGFERMHRTAEEWKRLRSTSQGALSQIDGHIMELEVRVRQVEAEIARRNGKH